MTIPTGSLLAISTATELAGHGLRAAANALRKPFSFGANPDPATAPGVTQATLPSSSSSSSSSSSASSTTSSNTLQDRLQALFQQARKSLGQLGFNSQQSFEVQLQPGEAPLVQSEDLEFSMAMESWIREHPEAQQQLQEVVSQLSENQPSPFAASVASPLDKRRTTLQLLSTPTETRWKWRGE